MQLLCNDNKYYKFTFKDLLCYTCQFTLKQGDNKIMSCNTTKENYDIIYKFMTDKDMTRLMDYHKYIVVADDNLSLTDHIYHCSHHYGDNIIMYMDCMECREYFCKLYNLINQYGLIHMKRYGIPLRMHVCNYDDMKYFILAAYYGLDIVCNMLLNKLFARNIKSARNI